MVYLFIFESIGTQELILIGIIAMIFLGPRKLPEYAKKIGKMMAEFRGTAQDFRTTWEREVNFEEEAEAIRSGELRETKPIPRIKTADNDEPDAAEQMIKTIGTTAGYNISVILPSLLPQIAVESRAQICMFLAR